MATYLHLRGYGVATEVAHCYPSYDKSGGYVNVTVSIPANAKPGLYGGTLMGTASAVQKGSGNITSNVGAGDREYIRVG